MTSDDTKPTDYRIEAARLALDAFDAAPPGSVIQDDAAYDAARMLGPVLAYLDAIAAGEAPDGEAERAEAAKLALFVSKALSDECIALRAIAADPKAHAADLVAQEKALHALEVEERDAAIARLQAELATEQEAHRVASAALHDRTAELAEAETIAEAWKLAAETMAKLRHVEGAADRDEEQVEAARGAAIDAMHRARGAGGTE